MKKRLTLMVGVLLAGLFTTGALLFTGLPSFAGELPVDEDCPQRALGAYCPDDPSPVDNPNLDCPERALGLYCPGDPSPVENPNVGSSGGGDEQDCCPGPDPDPAPAVQKQPQVKGATSIGRVGSLDRLAPLNSIFRSVYDRNPSFTEWSYWANRMLTDKPQHDALFGAMQWHSVNGITH